MIGANARAHGQLSNRGTVECRGCSQQRLESVLDLGAQPLANELLISGNLSADLFPLHLRVCMGCGLGQVGEFVLPQRIFGEYPYLSSMSTSWLQHSRRFAQAQTARLRLGHDSWVLEVASNDGYLLGELKALGVDVLGVEPASNVAEIARAKGIDTVTAFFGEETARAIRATYGAPRLIVANNVMAHVPDLDDFLRGFLALCDEHTLISVENPSFVALLREGTFDTIYHEHFSYLSAHAVQTAARIRGLELIDIEWIPTHGGSYRYWMGMAGRHLPAPAVMQAVQAELDSGLLSPALHEKFASTALRTISGLQEWAVDRVALGRTIVAYGAAAKGNTLLNAADIDTRFISCVVDASPEKQGKFLPGSRIPVLAPATLGQLRPDDVLILPWNIRDEVVPFVGSTCPEANLWIAVPEMAIVST